MTQKCPAGRLDTMTCFFHLAIDCSGRKAVFAWFPILTGQIGIVQPITGRLMFVMAPESGVAPVGIRAKPWNTLVLRCAVHLNLCSSPLVSGKLELFASNTLRKPGGGAATFQA